MKKENTKNKQFNTVKEKLEFMQKACPETELFEDLKQLFLKKGFCDVSITHGINEFGKDLVFAMENPAFGEKKWYSAVVKNKNASVNDFNDGGEILKQINMSFNVPYKDVKGKDISISGVFVIVNGSISFQAREIMKPYIQNAIIEHVQIWDYQKLAEEIENYIKELFLDKLEPIIHVFSKSQVARLSDLSNTRNLLNLNIKEIDDIFVNVETTYSRQQKQFNEYVSFETPTSTEAKIESLDAANEVLKSSKNFVIHGIPTSGKSLLLRRIGLKAIEQKTGKPNAVFYFELNKIVNKDNAASSLDIIDCVKNQFSELTEGEVFNATEYNKVYLLFDGLDDIKTEIEKKEIISIIDKFKVSDAFGHVQIVVTMRTTEIVDNEELLKDFEKSELLPFNIGQALKLVKKIIPGNNEKSKSFVDALKHSLLDSGLLRTPLALTLLAILYRDDEVDLNELPANITELYSKFVDTYLDRWDSSKGISQQYKYDQSKIVLGFIGLHLQENTSDEISTENLTTFLNGLKKDYNIEVLNNVDEFVFHLKNKNGVFNYNEYNDTFVFYNHYFQEYFVSICIQDSDEGQLKENFFSEWWENTIVFYCGKQPRRDTFILDIAKTIVPHELKDKYNYLQLLSKCIQANHSIPNKSRLKVINRMLKEFDEFYNLFLAGGKEGKTFAASVTTMNLVLQFRDFFSKLFESKFICDEECLNLFESILVDDDINISEVTKYCIAYFVSFRRNNPAALEIFVSDESIDSIWSRVIFVDINFLHYKKKVNPETFKRVKRKMNKRKFEILNKLKGVSIEHLLLE